MKSQFIKNKERIDRAVARINSCNILPGTQPWVDGLLNEPGHIVDGTRDTAGLLEMIALVLEEEHVPAPPAPNTINDRG